jgi:hypothetical protein
MTSAPLYARTFLDAASGATRGPARHDRHRGNAHPAGSNDDATTAPDTFLRYMVLSNGRRCRTDMLGVNPYTERAPSTWRFRIVPPSRIDDFDCLVGEFAATGLAGTCSPPSRVRPEY